LSVPFKNTIKDILSDYNFAHIDHLDLGLSINDETT